MKKRFLSILLALSMLCAFIPITSSAYSGTQYGDYLYYEINDDNTAVTITDCNERATEIDIPSKINGLPVTSIGNSAFRNCSSLASITIPDSVISIGDNALYGCCGLTSITIPDSIISIGSYAFYYCGSLTSITVNENNKRYSSSDGVLYNKDKTELIQYPIGNTRTEFTIPDSVTSIDNNAFYGCSSLTSITIPDGVTEIGYGAFEGCSSLTRITIPDGVTEIDWYAFYGCSRLISITIPDSVIKIGGSAFYGCSSLTSITIPDSVTEIGYYAFEGCSSLISITIPDSVTEIGYGVFEGCSSLTSIAIPDGVTKIGNNAFSGCSKLKDVYFTGTENEWSNIDIDDGNDILKNATIHYNSTAPTPIPTPTPVPTTTAEVTKSETDTAYTFEVNAENKYEDCYVYAAVYDENGALIEINLVPLSTAKNTSISVDKNDNGKTIKIFLWTDTMQSIIEKAKEFKV